MPERLVQSQLQRLSAGAAPAQNPALIAHLQRVVGNRAVVEGLTPKPSPASLIHRSPEAIRRAIGFEFEFGTWRTAHAADQMRLEKGEEVIKGKGYKIEGEDATDGVSSAIEIVTRPFTTVDEATESIGEAQAKLKQLDRHGRDRGKPVKADTVAGGRANIDVTPNDGLGKMQASPAIALDKMGALYKQGVGQSYAQYASSVESKLADEDFKGKFLGGADASPELQGFLMLILSYLEQGSQQNAYGYPKTAFTIMARTSFTKMFKLVPEHEFFGNPENAGKWSEMVLTLSQQMIPKFKSERKQGKLKRKGFLGLFGEKYFEPDTHRPRSLDEIESEPVLQMPLNAMEPMGKDKDGTTYTSTVTRGQWLDEMPERDLLSKANDKRFEGMGAYGDATDVATDDDEVVNDQVVVDDTEEAVEKALGSEGVPEVSEEPVKPEATGEPTKKPKEAPLFEFRGMRDMFGIDQDIEVNVPWEEKVTDVFHIVDKANGQSFKPGGKPTVAEDVDNPKAWKKQKTKKKKK